MLWRRLLSRIQTVLSRRRLDSELAEELTGHVELQTRKHMARGLSEAEARRKARIEFGGIETVREECREIRCWRWLDASGRNVKHCFRSLKRSPVFVCVAIAILSVGIASNIATFSAIDALFLRTLPVKKASELVRIASVSKDAHVGSLPSTVIYALKGDPAFQGFCGFDTFYQAIGIAGGLRRLGAAAFTGGCFRMLGLQVQLGRGINPSDDWPGAEHVAVITDSLWHGDFGGRPDVLGQTIRIGDRVYTIVGVTQKGFTGLLLGFPEPVMIPLRQEPAPLQPPSGGTYWVNVLARRAPGVSLAKARADISARASRILLQSVPPRSNALQRKAYLGNKLIVLDARGGVDYFLRRRFGEPMYALWGLCAVLLLMSGVSLTGLLLARSLSRAHEAGIRVALGASRTNIASIFLFENAVLLLAGCALGTLGGIWAVHIVLARSGQMFGNLNMHVGVDVRVIGFLIAAFVLIMGMFTAASVWQATRLAGTGNLKRSGRGIVASNSMAQKLLLSTQVALALALVAGAALLGASVRDMYGINLGIQPRNVWAIMLEPRPGGYDHFTPEPYYRDLVQQIQSLPGIVSVSAGNTLPFSGSQDGDTVALIDGARPVSDTQADVESIGDHFFETMGARIIAGKDFDAREDQSSEPEVIISRSLAERLGSPRELIGHHLRVGTSPRYQRVKIEGVASDVDLDLSKLGDTKPPTVWVNFWQNPYLERSPVVLVKTATTSLDATAIRRIVARKGREFVERSETVSSAIDGALVENRYLAYISGGFGLLALAMAAAGLFGLLSYQATNRTAEIGIRLALGARPSQIRWLFLRQALVVVVPGCMLGLGLLFVVQELMGGLFFQASAYDPRFLIFSVAVLAGSALAAAWLPVRRASRIDPAAALRHD